jgi:hypothetical protein
MKTDDVDVLIEETLRSQPDFMLSADFARQVTAVVMRKVQWKNDLHEYLYLMVVIISLLTVVAGLFYYIDKDVIVHMFSFISGNAVQVFLAVLLLNFILFADKVLLGLLFSQRKT